MKRQFPCEVLWCPNRSGKRVVAAGGARRTGWIFPPAVEARLLEDCRGLSVLQLFGGRSSWGTRLDVDPFVHPDVIGDAWLPPFGKDSFDVVIIDPPYVTLSAQLKHSLFCAANFIARRRVVWFSTIWVAASSGFRTEASWLVRVGDSCHVRCLQYFSIRKKMEPVARFKRGPQMKYNRWLIQPEYLPHSGAGANEASGIKTP
jgi:hypothetical protein